MVCVRVRGDCISEGKITFVQEREVGLQEIVHWVNEDRFLGFKVNQEVCPCPSGLVEVFEGHIWASECIYMNNTLEL